MDAEPQVPLGFEIGAWSAAVLAVALVVSALWSMYRTQSISTSERLIWTLIVVLLPFVGSILWFFLAARRRQEAR